MNIIKIRTQLLQYLEKNYDLTDSNILRKYNHIQKVAEYAKNIAEELNLKKEEQDLAYVLGLFHDYGRFEQWKRYQTYNDSLSVSHAKLGTKLLFQNNEINYFSVPKKHYNILKTAIDEHSNLTIDPTVVNPQTRLFCKIIRDADKSHLYELYIAGAIPNFTNLDGFTKEVLDCVNNRTAVEAKFVKTKLDRALSTLCSTYDIEFLFTYRKLIEIDYFNALKKQFATVLIKEDCVLLEKCIQIVENNIKKAFNTFDNVYQKH